MMKKLLLTAAVVSLAAGATLAQDSDFKATAGNKTLEANVNLFGKGDSTISLMNNHLNQIKVRYFMNENTALRLGFNVGIHTETEPGATSGDKTTNRSFTLSIMPGIEKHFEGTDRLSPYIGAEVGIALDSRKTTVVEDGKTFATTGTSDGKRGYFQFGLNALAGFDFYVARHLYVGYELGFGVIVKSDSDVTPDGGTAEAGNTHFELGPNVMNGVRVGFVF
ncbi:MAG: hypothetical protein EOP53_24085 [Sphingobacteriales bacterium]|nr:MAG: hypothetical protein EOP53_24085 [Sphingobacteriales bacterium]